MSPIIMEPDVPEGPLKTDTVDTPFPEDISATSTPFQDSDVTSQKSIGSPSENEPDSETLFNGKKVDYTAGKKCKLGQSQVKKNDSFQNSKQSFDQLHENPSISRNLKRSQSLRSRNMPGFHHNENTNGTEILKLSSPAEFSTVLPKQNKPGKFNIFKTRFGVFPKSLQSTEGKGIKDDSPYSLRRSQSMRISKKPNASMSTPQFVPMETMAEKLPKHDADGIKISSNASIKNSKSLIDVRHPGKKANSLIGSHVDELIGSHVDELNNAKRIQSNGIKNRVTNLRTKIKNSSESNLACRDMNQSKNFAHKTIDVIRKSVQGKFKASVDKKDKKNLGSSLTNRKSKQENADLKKKAKIVTNSSKDQVKMNSKRKKSDFNDSDSEFTAKKMASSNDKIRKDDLIKGNKENKITTLASKSRTRLYGNNVESAKIMNNKNNHKVSPILSNKKIKENNSTVLINMKNNRMIKRGETPTSKSKNENNESEQISQDATMINPTAVSLQNHHAIFLNNIQETLNNCYKMKHDKTIDKNLTINQVDSAHRNKTKEPVNNNIYELVSSRFSNSLPFILAEIGEKSTSIIDQAQTNLTKSYSETFISEKSMTMSTQEIDMKSLSPASNLNYDDESFKVEFQSPMSFTHYDPYIDESMEDYWVEGDEESYFGTLFAESNLIWETFPEPLNGIELETEHYFIEDDILLNKYEHNEHYINKGSSVDNNAPRREFLEHLRFTSSHQQKEVFLTTGNFPAAALRRNELCANECNRSLDQPYTDRNFKQPTDTSFILDEPLESFEAVKEAVNEAYPDSKTSLNHEPFAPRENSYPTVIPEEPDSLKIPPYNTINNIDHSSKPLSITTKKLPNDPKSRKKNIKPAQRQFSTKAQTRIISPSLAEPKSVSKPTNSKVFAAKNYLDKHKELTSLRKGKSELEYFHQKGIGRKDERRNENAKSLCNLAIHHNEFGNASSQSYARVEDEKKRQELSAASSRRSKIDSSKASLTKPSKGSARIKLTDPVKVLRPAAPNGQPAHQAPHQGPPQQGDQLKKLEAELCARTQEVQSAKEEAARTNRGLEALTVLVHYLTEEYDAFSSLKFKAEVERLTEQLTDVRLCLDESTAAARRLENEVTERSQKHADEVETLRGAHQKEVEEATLQHRRNMEQALENHQMDLRNILSAEQNKHEELKKSHTQELERIDREWRTEMDKQHERHLQALEQLNTCHTQQLRDAELSWNCRERELEEANTLLLKEQVNLKYQTKKLEETLLSDKDHRLQAAKRLCADLQKEVESLKTVVEMRNCEVHKLRDQLADKERVCEELDAARDRVRALQAKTEDLHAQMKKKSQLERQLLADHHSLSDSLQREASANKRLSLENEELQWKLRQREAAAGSLPTPTLDLVTRCSSAIVRQQEGCKTGPLSPQFTPRIQRIGTKNTDKKWSQSFSNIPEDARKLLRRTELQHDDVSIESPPPSPRVKAVIEKSNSVSFILDLNDTFPDDHFLGRQSPQLGKKPLTPNLQRKSLHRTVSNSLEKSSSTSHIHINSKSFNTYATPKLNGKGHKDSRETRYFSSHNTDAKQVNGNGHSEKANGIYSLDTHLPVNKKYSRTHSTSESSDSGDVERISPTGLSWTVPVHTKTYSKHIPNRFQLVPEPPRLLQQPDEDEYEEMENENEFVEVLALGDDLSSAPLTTLFAQTPSTSVSLSDSDISQCGSRADLSTDEGTDDDEGTLLQKDSQIRPQEGAGEAMIFPDGFDLKSDKNMEHISIEQMKEDYKQISKSQISSAPSSDSEDVNQPMNEGVTLSWSEDVDCDLTSSSEMQELL